MEAVITIPIKELNEVCTKPDRKFSTKTHFNLTNREYIHDIFKYQKFNDDFAKNIIVQNNGKKDFIGSFKPSYVEFLDSIIEALNFKSEKTITDDEELTKKLEERIEFLRTLPDDAWLYNHFPVLYRNLQDGRNYINEVEKLKKNPLYEEVAKEEEHYYYACAMKKSLYNFIKSQTTSYERFIAKRHEYRDLISKKNYNKFIKENYDQDKLAMYLAHKYLSVCEEHITNKSILKKYIKLLDKYVSSSYKKDVSITVNGMYIDYRNIYARIKNVHEALNKIDAKVEWILISEGKKPTYIKAGLNPKMHIMSQEELNALREAGEAKEKFYNDNPPLLKVYGTLKYSGYIAYIYENGEVLFDMEYNQEYPNSAKGNAIYYMKASYFDIVSGLNKQVLKNHPAVDRIVHAGSWEERAQKIIDREGTEEEKEEAKKLVKRLQEQNEKNI